MPNIESLGKRLVSFAGGDIGEWTVNSIKPVLGESLAEVKRVKVCYPPLDPALEKAWELNGVISNVRYVEKNEKAELSSKQAGLGRPEATMAALIPIKKSPAWWDMTQDQRREIFEARSHHTAEGLKYLPAIARQLYHSRDLGEPFDFLTWFEYAPEHSGAFEDLVQYLRGTEEWRYVDREVDIRLSRVKDIR